MGVSESRDSRANKKIEIAKYILKDKCVICLEDMVENITWLPCAHCYHEECLNLWELNCKEKNRTISCCLCDLKY